jgi:hypothetical protein
MKKISTDDFEAKIINEEGSEYVKVIVKSENFAKAINKHCGDSSFGQVGMELFLGMETFNKITENFKK